MITKIKIHTVQLFLLIVVAAAFSSCTKVNQKIIVRTYQVGDFSSLSCDGNLDVQIIPGQKSRVWVKGIAGQVDKIEVKKEKNKLVLYDSSSSSPFVKEKIIFGKLKSPIVYVAAPNLQSLSVSGNSSVSMDKPVSWNKLYATVDGNTDVGLKLNHTRNLILEVSGNSDANITCYNCGESRFSVSGNSDIDVNFKDCDRSFVELDGNSDASLKGTLRHRLTSNVSGNSDIDNNIQYIK